MLRGRGKRRTSHAERAVAAKAGERWAATAHVERAIAGGGPTDEEALGCSTSDLIK
jgi:hypothetical protein